MDPLQPLLAVLDLDGTIVHAHSDCRMPYDFQIGDCSNRLYVHMRPGISSFLEWLRQSKIEVAIYTAGTAEYASSVVKNLDPRGNLVQQSFSRDDCVPHATRLNTFTKDLTKLRGDMRRIVLIDNNRMSFSLQPNNGIHVEDWLGQSTNDMELVRVRSILEKLVHASDVREVLSREPQLPVNQSPTKSQTCAGCRAVVPQGGYSNGRWYCARCWRAWGCSWPMAPSVAASESWWGDSNLWGSPLQTQYAWRNMGGQPYHMAGAWPMAGNLPSSFSTGAPWNTAAMTDNVEWTPPWIREAESLSQSSSLTGSPQSRPSDLSQEAGSENSQSPTADDSTQYMAAKAGA